MPSPGVYQWAHASDAEQCERGRLGSCRHIAPDVVHENRCTTPHPMKTDVGDIRPVDPEVVGREDAAGVRNHQVALVLSSIEPGAGDEPFRGTAGQARVGQFGAVKREAGRERNVAVAEQSCFQVSPCR